MEFAFLKCYFIEKIVSLNFFIIILNIFNIVETFNLLLEEKKDFYIKLNGSNPPELEEIRLNQIIKRYHLEGIYYSLDNHNIFKRADRYQYKIRLIIMFAILVIYNIFEIIFNIITLTVIKKPFEKFSGHQRFLTALLSLINILVILILSSITVTKLKIQSYVFY